MITKTFTATIAGKDYKVDPLLNVDGFINGKPVDVYRVHGYPHSSDTDEEFYYVQTGEPPIGHYLVPYRREWYRSAAEVRYVVVPETTLKHGLRRIRCDVFRNGTWIKTFYGDTEATALHTATAWVSALETNLFIPFHGRNFKTAAAGKKVWCDGIPCTIQRVNDELDLFVVPLFSLRFPVPPHEYEEPWLDTNYAVAMWDKDYGNGRLVSPTYDHLYLRQSDFDRPTLQEVADVLQQSGHPPVVHVKVVSHEFCNTEDTPDTTSLELTVTISDSRYQSYPVSFIRDVFRADPRRPDLTLTESDKKRIVAESVMHEINEYFYSLIVAEKGLARRKSMEDLSTILAQFLPGTVGVLDDYDCVLWDTTPERVYEKLLASKVAAYVEKFKYPPEDKPKDLLDNYHYRLPTDIYNLRTEGVDASEVGQGHCLTLGVSYESEQ